MHTCPKCGSYMHAQLQQIFGGWRTVWSCPCGYSTEQESTAMSTTTKITVASATNTAGNIQFDTGDINYD